jgi:glutamate N-acetyltransferase/amino-acid N-acetyltransferase
MKNPSIDIEVDIFTGTKDFTVFTMDLTNEYIKINSDYRS